MRTPTVEVQEGGVSRGSFGSYTTGDRFRVELLDGAVSYLQNGILLYASGVGGVYPLWASTALYDTGATLSDVVVSEIVWTAATGVSTASGSLTKTGSAGWNAGAASTASITGDGFVEFTASETNATRTCGLADQDASYDPAEIDSRSSSNRTPTSASTSPGPCVERTGPTSPGTTFASRSGSDRSSTGRTVSSSTRAR